MHSLKRLAKVLCFLGVTIFLRVQNACDIFSVVQIIVCGKTDFVQIYENPSRWRMCLELIGEAC